MEDAAGTAVSRLYTDAEQALIDRFESVASGLPGGGWVTDKRTAALDAFRESGLPHRRIEEWKYTDLRGAIREAFPPGKAVAGAIPRSRLADAGYATITIVNGMVTSDIPTIDGVTIRTLSDALASGDETVRDLLAMDPARGSNPVLDLNTAYMDHGLVIEVAEGAAVETPLQVRSVVNAAEPASYYGRVLVKVGAGSSFTLIESFRGEETAFQRNGAIQVDVGDGANFTHIRIEDETDDAVHLSNVIVEIGEKAAYSKIGLSIGAALMRNDLSIAFKGEHSTADVASVFMKSGKQHHDTTMFVDHAVPNCVSRELFKSVLGGEARGVFQGKILVRPDAQKTDGQMSANAILLTEEAEMDAKPELEIYADDVVCGHGATSGQLDEDLLFFLKSRGIPDRAAKSLLIEAFIGAAFDSVELEPVRDALANLTHEWVEDADI